ncbi:MAG: 1-deoxy-D-xylulose-5-phosphate reductoisomerase [Treponema sp.]|nr:1-deoxy-D-xylulose-5-phosphate reductoisomerase [Treponema sp.]
MKKRVAVLGATGSIGKSALDVIARGKDHFELVLLSSHRNGDALAALGRQWPGAAAVLSGETGGRERLFAAIADSGADITLNGISGAAGLEPSIAAIEAGSDIALANKETLVMAGPLVMQLVAEKKVNIIPVDSEHSAVFNLIENLTTNQHQPTRTEERSLQSTGSCSSCGSWLNEIILTASGGPFRERSLKEMENVTAKEALAHPTWNMGAKITIDSASMANKGLEVIEAAHLFNVPSEKIKVVIHPQSIVHSMIRTKDGAVYAQLSRPDMRHPIHAALYWPAVAATDLGRLDFDTALSLDFFPPDMERFPLLALAYEAVRKGGLYPCVYNAANEAAVAAFLAGRIGFLDISRITGYVLDRDWSTKPDDIAAIMEADRQARIMAEKEF